MTNYRDWWSNFCGFTHTSQLPTSNETLRFPCVQQLDSTTPKFVKHDEDDNLRGISIYIANPNVIILAIHVGLKLFFLLYVQVHSPIICLSHNISTLFYSIFNNYINYIRWITIFSKRKKKGKKERWITILSKFSFHLISLIDSVQYDDPYHNKLTVPMKK